MVSAWEPTPEELVYPLVMIHGGGPTTTFTGTPEGRPGWADYFLKQGWPVYVVDQPGRGKTPHIEALSSR